MNRRILLRFAFGLALVSIVGCAAPPPEQDEAATETSSEETKAEESTVLHGQDFESGQVQIDSEPGADEEPEEGQNSGEGPPQ